MILKSDLKNFRIFMKVGSYTTDTKPILLFSFESLNLPLCYCMRKPTGMFNGCYLELCMFDLTPQYLSSKLNKHKIHIISIDKNILQDTSDRPYALLCPYNVIEFFDTTVEINPYIDTVAAFMRQIPEQFINKVIMGLYHTDDRWVSIHDTELSSFFKDFVSVV